MKYRILQDTYKNYYYPQYKGWFRWKFFLVPTVWSTVALEEAWFPNYNAAVEFLSNKKAKDEHRARQNAPDRYKPIKFE